MEKDSTEGEYRILKIYKGLKKDIFTNYWRETKDLMKKGK